MIRSIPIKDLEALATEWEGYAAARTREHKEAASLTTYDQVKVGTGLLSAAQDLRALIRELTVG